MKIEQSERDTSKDMLSLYMGMQLTAVIIVKCEDKAKIRRHLNKHVKSIHGNAAYTCHQCEHKATPALYIHIDHKSLGDIPMFTFNVSFQLAFIFCFIFTLITGVRLGLPDNF